MAQVRKDEIQQRIAEAALEEFAARGYEDAAMAQIAKAAGVSTGNIYRYYANKDALFDAVVTGAFAARFMDLVRRRVTALGGVADVGDLPADAPFFLVSAELQQFCLDHRLQVVILLDKAAGSRFAGIRAALQAMLVDLAIQHFQGLDPALVVSDRLRFTLETIYRHFVTTLVVILREYRQPEAIREAVAAYSRYHLAGLKALFGH